MNCFGERILRFSLSLVVADALSLRLSPAPAMRTLLLRRLQPLGCSWEMLNRVVLLPSDLEHLQQSHNTTPPIRWY
jgi:hypothetical protein